MDIFDILDLVGGLALFLFGMNIMGAALEKKAGGQLKSLLGKMTSNPFKGFLLGAGITAIIQSSSATTVMVVGFVNSGIMTLRQAIGVIMGANVGTTITAWLLSLMAIDGAGTFMAFLKPSSFVPVLAIFGVAMLMFKKSHKSKDTASIMLGFATLMTGMSIMSDSVAGLKDVPEFTNILTAFSNPALGVLAGAGITAIIQSSSASVGILQALSVTGAIPFSTAIPVIMGQGIGTTVTALISSAGANKDAKRAAFAHFYFNAISTPILLAIFYGLNAVVGFDFLDDKVNEFWIAVINTAFKLCCVALWMPFTKLLEKIAVLTVKDKDERSITKFSTTDFLQLPLLQLRDVRLLPKEWLKFLRLLLTVLLIFWATTTRSFMTRLLSTKRRLTVTRTDSAPILSRFRPSSFPTRMRLRLRSCFTLSATLKEYPTMR